MLGLQKHWPHHPHDALKSPPDFSLCSHHTAVHVSCKAFLHSTHKPYTALQFALQILSTRKRKDVEVADIKVQVCLYAFDCLYQNGEVLVDRPLTERREMLYNSLAEKEGELLFAEAKVSLPAH